MHYSTFLRWINVCSGHFRQVLSSFGGTKKVVAGHVKQVVVLYMNDCMGIVLGRLNISRLGKVVVL